MITEHRQDIFDAVRDTLLDLEEDHLSYSNLYKKVNEKLKYLKHRRNFKQLSRRDFNLEVKLMVEEGRINRFENKVSKLKIKPVYFSLTETAKKEHRLKILGIDKEAEKRRRLYQILFFFECLDPMKEISDKELDRILSSIHASRNDLVPESNIHIIGTNYTETNYKPIEYTKIQKVELSVQQPNTEKKTIYYCKLPGFSIEEVKHNLIYSPRGSYAQFIKDIDLSEEKIEEIFEILRQTGLIRPLSVLDEREIKFCINDESLRELIDKIWEIHQLELAVLQNKWNHFEEPNEVQKQWLLHIFGEKRSDYIINKSYWNRKSFNKIKNEEEISRVKQEIKIFEKAITQRVQNLNKKYEKVIQEYAFPPDLVESVCLRKIFNQ